MRSLCQSVGNFLPLKSLEILTNGNLLRLVMEAPLPRNNEGSGVDNVGRVHMPHHHYGWGRMLYCMPASFHCQPQQISAKQLNLFDVRLRPALQAAGDVCGSTGQAQK